MHKKTKFTIQGINSQDQALLVEEKLKGRPGIIRARVNYESQKGVVVYDEQQVKESDIQQIVEGLKNYHAEAPSLTKILFLLRILTGISFLALISNIILLFVFIQQLPAKAGKQPTQEAGLPLPPSPPPDRQPDIQPTIIQEFKITKDNHIRGDFKAPITLVEFSDFECPFCEKISPTLNKILNDYKGKVRLVYKHYPLPFHPNAQKAAEASECADEQGKFWEYHDKLFENQPSGFSLEKFKQWAKELGLNTKKFNDCLDTDKYAKKVQDDYQEGSAKSVNGTPATFVNGQLVSGAVPYDSFKQIIDNLLQ